LLAQSTGKLAAEAPVLLGELPDAGVRGFEPPQEGSAGGALASRNRGRGRAAVCRSQALDFSSQVRLGIQPGPGDARSLRDGLERDWLARHVK